MRADSRTARHVAHNFLRSARSGAWGVVDPMLLVNSIVMDHVNFASAIEADAPITPTQLIEFRDLVIAALAKKGYVLP